MGPQVRPSILLSCLLVALSAAAQENSDRRPGDFHTRADEARRLYSISAFAHGHRHGYEEGFRVADEEIHAGRLRRTLKEKDVPKPKDYKSSFGNKKVFRHGFTYGFIAGYRDSYEERSFTRPEWTAEVPPFSWMSDLPQVDADPIPDTKQRAEFEAGILEGYRSGNSIPGEGRDAKTLATQAADACKVRPNVPKDSYCDGFTQGFLLGVNDSAVPRYAGRSDLANNVNQPQ